MVDSQKIRKVITIAKVLWMLVHMVIVPIVLLSLILAFQGDIDPECTGHGNWIAGLWLFFSYVLFVVLAATDNASLTLLRKVRKLRGYKIPLFLLFNVVLLFSWTVVGLVFFCLKESCVCNLFNPIRVYWNVTLTFCCSTKL